MASSSRSLPPDNVEIGPTPSFDLGITEEEQRTKLRHDGMSKKETKRGKKTVNEGRIRIKSKIGKVYTLFTQARVNMHTFKRKQRKLKLCGFQSLVDICNWNAVSTNFVKWVVDNWEVKNGPQIRLSETEVLRISEDDIHRVYNLPRGDQRVDLLSCTTESMKKLWSEIGLEGEVSKTVHFRKLEERLDLVDGSTAWAKCVILYIIYCLLCPVNSNLVDFRYAAMLDDLKDVTKYNWCRHVLEHTTKGINENNKMNPTADFHFLLINYLERMGKKCRLMAGQYAGPSLGGWDQGVEMTYLNTLEEMVGLSKGVVVGITRDTKTAEQVPTISSLMKRNIEVLTLCDAKLDMFGKRMDKFERTLKLPTVATTHETEGKRDRPDQTTNEDVELLNKKRKKGKSIADSSSLDTTPPRPPIQKGIRIVEGHDVHQVINPVPQSIASPTTKYYTRSSKRGIDAELVESTGDKKQAAEKALAMATTAGTPKKSPTQTKESIRWGPRRTNEVENEVGHRQTEDTKV